MKRSYKLSGEDSQGNIEWATRAIGPISFNQSRAWEHNLSQEQTDKFLSYELGSQLN